MTIINKKTVLYTALAALALVLYGCGKDKETPAPEQASTPAVETVPAAMEAATPITITFTKPALYPEGIDYDAKGERFLVTSLREGIVSAVKEDGTINTLLQDPKMVSAIGIRIDAQRDRVLVCNSDPGASVHTKPETQGKLAGLAIFQLSSGALLNYMDLGALADGAHFCNDIALDAAGNAYISDSFSPIIYKVDVENNASILLNDPRFVGEGFNLNGLVVKDDYLIVAKYNEGLLFKVPLADPAKFTEISVPEKMIGADGLLWAADGDLVVIANLETNKIFKLNSTDEWTTATITGTVDTGPVFATTGVLKDGGIYVLNAMLHVLFNPETKDHVEKFEIHEHKL